jgi:hypothetical protein
MTDKLKKYSTIACCGIDCGLCPRFHTKGNSACPGCGGLNFKEKHPSCGFLTCCVTKNGLEVCSDCKDYPCRRFEPERQGFDSFVTHKKMFTNLDFIKNNGMNCFLEQQKTRMNILADFLTDCDDGRSKNFFCISCALIPLDELQQIHRFMISLPCLSAVKEKNKMLKDRLQIQAKNLKLDLKLNNKR